MFGCKIRLKKSLYEKIKIYSGVAGYSSIDEFVTHVLEKEIAHFDRTESGNESEEQVRERMRGLGYLSSRKE